MRSAAGATRIAAMPRMATTAATSQRASVVPESSSTVASTTRPIRSSSRSAKYAARLTCTGTPSPCSSTLRAATPAFAGVGNSASPAMKIERLRAHGSQ